MFKKLFLTAAVSLIALGAYAQKPLLAAITDIEEDPTNGLEMSRSLFNEYFLAELTTRAKINVVDTATTQKRIAALKLERGKKLSVKSIRDLCKSLKTDALCLVSMKRTGKKNTIDVTVRVVNSNGKLLGSSKGNMKMIGDAGKVSIAISSKVADLIRSLNGTQAIGKKIDRQLHTAITGK